MEGFTFRRKVQHWRSRQGLDSPPEDAGESKLSFLRLVSSLANGRGEEVGKGEDKDVVGSWWDNVVEAGAGGRCGRSVGGITSSR